ncbi:MAG TPA: hypothetical protein VEC99_12785 [Clostridia bacterium]|nr:hypothetical protein [Clostridia bacterium]
MRNLICICLAVLSLFACSPKPSQAPNTALNFYIVSSQKMPRARFFDTTRFPQLGWIANKPDLVITNLRSVSVHNVAPVSTLDITNTAGDAVTNIPKSGLAINFNASYREAFEALTKRAAGKRLLVMLGDRPLFAPQIGGPIESAGIGFDFRGELGNRAEVQNIVDDLQKLVQ